MGFAMGRTQAFADRKSTRLNSSHITRSRMPSSSRNTGKAPMVQEDDVEAASGSEYDDEDDDEDGDATEEDSE